MTIEQIADHIGVDSLGYLSLDGMLKSVPGGPHGFCHACFSGDYPTPPPTDPDKLRFGCGMLMSLPQPAKPDTRLGPDACSSTFLAAVPRTARGR